MITTFINPFTDFGFKKIFGGDPVPSGGVLGSRQEASKPHLIDFLNSLLPAFAQIKDLSFKNLEQLPSIENERKAVYDIYCQGTNGEYFIVELQKLKQDFFKDRTLFYVTFPIQQQAQKGSWNYKLAPVYCIAILDFTFDDDRANLYEVVHKVNLKDQNNNVFSDKLTLMYLEMPNFKKGLEELETRLDKWLYFINNLKDLQSIPELLKDETFSSAFEVAKFSNLDQKGRDQYEYSLKIIRDNYATQQTAFAEGQAEGEAVGEARGELNANLKTARNLKTLGLNLEQIAAATGLSVEELEQGGIA
jgi:predicted transposase/invertase (TIGR01784 family)